MADRIIVYGLSNAGLRIAEFLHEAGASVTIVAHEHSRLLGEASESGIEVLTEDVRDLDTLDKLDLSGTASIIFSSEDDQFNIHAALKASETNPALTIVTRVFNVKLAERLEKSLPKTRILSVSQMAAPTFAVSALLRDSILSLAIDGRMFSFYEVDSAMLTGGPAWCAGAIEDAKGIRIVAADGILLTDGEAELRSSSRLICFSSFETARGLFGETVGPAEPSHRTETAHRTKKRLFSLTRLLEDRVLTTTLAVLLGIFVFSICFFMKTERLGVLDAVYFVVTVLTTVGFGDINLKDSSVYAKMVGIVLMVSGAVLMAILFAFIADGMIKKRLETLMGRRKMHLRGHVVLCGLGDVGIRILENLLDLGEDVVVIEKNQENKFLQRLRNMGVQFIVADATFEDALEHANVMKAKAIICATNDDLVNLESGLNALAMRDSIPVILRVFDEGFAGMVGKKFAIRNAFSSSHLAAASFASAALGSGVINAIETPCQKLYLVRKVAEADVIFDQTIGNEGVRVLMVVEQDGTVHLGTEKTCLEQGDTVYYISSGRALNPVTAENGSLPERGTM